MNDNELVKALRDECEDCGYCKTGKGLKYCPVQDAATRIEQLACDNNTLRNELCERCGRYKLAHEGSCDGCRWHKKGED